MNDNPKIAKAQEAITQLRGKLDRLSRASRSAQRHFMLPGTHEWPRTPECNCGADWHRYDDACTRQVQAAEESER